MKTASSIKDLYNHIYNQKFVSGGGKELDELAIDIDQYIAGVMGLANQYLNGKIPPIELIKGEDKLLFRMENVTNRLHNIQTSLIEAIQLAKILQDELNNTKTEM
jgi:hypothetical protein